MMCKHIFRPLQMPESWNLLNWFFRLYFIHCSTYSPKHIISPLAKWLQADTSSPSDALGWSRGWRNVCGENRCASAETASPLFMLLDGTRFRGQTICVSRNSTHQRRNNFPRHFLSLCVRIAHPLALGWPIENLLAPHTYCEHAQYAFSWILWMLAIGSDVREVPIFQRKTTSSELTYPLCYARIARRLPILLTETCSWRLYCWSAIPAVSCSIAPSSFRCHEQLHYRRAISLQMKCDKFAPLDE